MKKRLLPIPLILLIPILLLVVVTIAGIYRFSLSDEEIIAKFPNQTPRVDSVMREVFGRETVHPWTVKVPESEAFTFVSDQVELGVYRGSYQEGAERGELVIDTQHLTQVADDLYLHPIVVSNQGSGRFSYLALSQYDSFRQRMMSRSAEFLGDRISIEGIELEGNLVKVTIQEREAHQSMAEEPRQITTILFKLTEQDSLAKQ
ncbi:hypothetical protein FCU94_18630 [Vibrio sp. JPW-9-11-11]|uniref:hypothetical protein n=1 Tax=Vibrio sp. JPW-9-11-11 TaxID=1416532 RepID=UPI001593D0A4|nr:hypothetical protein [Vibrio sp. JPW-9-11-11]NVD08868.1 hypothetical protein [Vibrio sp. JPW-9-11-11]